MSADKSMLDRLMAVPRKELVDDVIFYHDGWIAAGRECNELKAENAKLRNDLETQRETAWHNTKRNAREYKRVCDENDQLRELAKYAILCSEGGVRCEACPYHDKTREPHIFCTIRKAARELGIEVPE